jgi:hypothetical protein
MRFLSKIKKNFRVRPLNQGSRQEGRRVFRHRNCPGSGILDYTRVCDPEKSPALCDGHPAQCLCKCMVHVPMPCLYTVAAQTRRGKSLASPIESREFPITAIGKNNIFLK